MANEEASYDVVQKNDIYEIRYYSDRLIVQVPNMGDNNSFRKLFKYISGENKKSEKIALTVPVTQTKKECLQNITTSSIRGSTYLPTHTP